MLALPPAITANRHRSRWASCVVVLALAACSSPPKPVALPLPIPRPGPAPASERDGPEARPPADLIKLPDPVPQIEPIRVGGPNKPYEVLGQSYTPITIDQPFKDKGLASWYGRKFHGRSTASGETYNMYGMTAAHPTLPIPSYVRVRNPANQREVIVRINDRGPFHSERIIDVSYTAALKLDILRGVTPVEISRITFDEIRAGSWRRNGDGDAATAPSPVAEAAAPTPPVLAPGSANEKSLEAETIKSSSVAGGQAAPAVPSTKDQQGRAFTPASQGFWVQLGAFGQREGAVRFQQKVSDLFSELAPMLAIFREAGVHRLQLGPYSNRDEAVQAAERAGASLKLKPIIVEKR